MDKALDTATVDADRDLESAPMRAFLVYLTTATTTRLATGTVMGTAMVTPMRM
jgi:hypothetical protein